MTFWGELTDGTEMLLGDPLEAQLIYDSDAPADQLTAVFPAEKLWEDLAVVRIFHEGQVVFGGIVDEQNTRLSGEGFQVELVCRGWEALLLDNEAQPGVLKNPSLAMLWEKYFKSLGFMDILGDKEPKSGELTVEKGASCWELLEGFCREYLGTVPYVDGGGVLHCEGMPTAQMKLEKVLSAELSRQPCKQLSAVWQQSFRGTYDTPFRNTTAWGVKRQRYVSMEDGRDPRALLREAQRESVLLTVECSGNHWPDRGAKVGVKAQRLGSFGGCSVRSARYSRDSRGERTKLVLEGGTLGCG